MEIQGISWNDIDPPTLSSISSAAEVVCPKVSVVGLPSKRIVVRSDLYLDALSSPLMNPRRLSNKREDYGD